MSVAVRVLVTGITGFAGRHLADHLTAMGDEVHGVVRPERTEPLPGGIPAHPAAITDEAALGALLRHLTPDVVMHLAGASSVGQSFDQSVATWNINLGGSLALLEAMRQNLPGGRCLIVTSGEIHGRVPLDELPVGPDTPMRPLSPYGASKAAADLLAGQYRAAYGLAVLRVRAFNHIGPGQDPRFVLPNVARQIAQAEGAGAAAAEVSVGNVETRRDFTDVRDTVRAYRLLAAHGDPDVPYLVCSGRSRAVRELVEGLVPLARIPVTVRSNATLRRLGEQPDLYGDPSRLMTDTGWRPEIPLATTLADTLRHWRERVAEAEESDES